MICLAVQKLDINIHSIPEAHSTQTGPTSKCSLVEEESERMDSRTILRPLIVRRINTLSATSPLHSHSYPFYKMSKDITPKYIFAVSEGVPYNGIRLITRVLDFDKL